MTTFRTGKPVSQFSEPYFFFASHFTFRCDLRIVHGKSCTQDFETIFTGFWDIHSDQMMNPNEAQDRCRPGQLFLRQHIPQNTFPPATAVLAPFQPLQPPQPAQAGCSGTVSLPLASTPPPETPEPQEASETDNSVKAGRGLGKWEEEEEKLLVQLWCDKHTRLESSMGGDCSGSFEDSENYQRPMSTEN